MDIVRHGLEHRARRLEAVGERIVLGQRALDAAVEQAAFEVPVQIRAAGAGDLLAATYDGVNRSHPVLLARAAARRS